MDKTGTEYRFCDLAEAHRFYREKSMAGVACTLSTVIAGMEWRVMVFA